MNNIILHIVYKIYDPNSVRYEVPLNLTSNVKPPQERPSTVYYQVHLYEETFRFEVERTQPTKRTL